MEGIEPFTKATMKPARIFQLTTLSLGLACSPFLNTSTAKAQTQSCQQPDNSGHNKHHAKTADNQPNAANDRLTTQKVRKAIIADKGLSMYAHNVKIITENGTVTLKGPVKSDEEKQKVAADAAGAVSQDKIVDQLTVKQ